MLGSIIGVGQASIDKHLVEHFSGIREVQVSQQAALTISYTMIRVEGHPNVLADNMIADEFGGFATEVCVSRRALNSAEPHLRLRS
jgi:hypothetical protein